MKALMTSSPLLIFIQVDMLAFFKPFETHFFLSDKLNCIKIHIKNNGKRIQF